MKPQRELPPEWDAKLIERGFQYRGIGSARQLAQRAGVSVTAALRVIFRENPGPEVTNAVADALGDRQFVAEWLDVRPIGRNSPPPAEYRYLSQRQQRIIDDLIRELAQGGQFDAGNAEAEKIDTSSQGDLGLAARQGSSDVDRYRQSIANVGEETQEWGE